MPKTFQFKSQNLVSEHFLLLIPIGKFTVPCIQPTDFSSKSHFFHSSPLLSRQTQIPKPIICARKRRRGSGSKKFRRILPKLVSFAASNLKIFPEPLDLVIAEFGGGEGGGSGFWKVFGNGNSDGWRRKGKTNLWVLRVLAVCGLGLSLFGRELKSEVLCGVLALSLLVAVSSQGYKRRVKDWILGLCFIGALMGLKFRREDVQQLVQRIRPCLPVLELVKGKRRNGRRIL